MKKKKQTSTGSFKIIKYRQTYKSGKFNKKTVNRIGFFLDKKPLSIAKLSELTGMTKDEILYNAKENTSEFEQNMKLALDTNYTMTVDYNKIQIFKDFYEFRTDSGKSFNTFEEFETYYATYLNNNFGTHFFGSIEFEINRQEVLNRILIFDDVTPWKKENDNKFIRHGRDYIITSTK